MTQSVDFLLDSGEVFDPPDLQLGAGIPLLAAVSVRVAQELEVLAGSFTAQLVKQIVVIFNAACAGVNSRKLLKTNGFAIVVDLKADLKVGEVDSFHEIALLEVVEVALLAEKE